jgi:hypothetical protein
VFQNVQPFFRILLDDGGVVYGPVVPADIQVGALMLLNKNTQSEAVIYEWAKKGILCINVRLMADTIVKFVGKARSLPWYGALEKLFTQVGSGLTRKN